MDARDQLTAILGMTVAEYRAFRKAVSVLMRAGVYNDEAVRVLLDARARRLTYPGSH